MNNYNDIELGDMTDANLKQFVGIATHKLEKEKIAHTKAKLALDLAQTYFDKLTLDYEAWITENEYHEPESPNSHQDRYMARKKVGRLEFRLKELDYYILYLKKTISIAKTEQNMRSGVHEKVCSIISDLFDEE